MSIKELAADVPKFKHNQKVYVSLEGATSDLKAILVSGPFPPNKEHNETWYKVSFGDIQMECPVSRLKVR